MCGCWSEFLQTIAEESYGKKKKHKKYPRTDPTKANVNPGTETPAHCWPIRLHRKLPAEDELVENMSNFMKERVIFKYSEQMK